MNAVAGGERSLVLCPLDRISAHQSICFSRPEVASLGCCFTSLICPLPNLQVFFLSWSQYQLVIYILVTNTSYLSLQNSAKSYLHKSPKYLLLLTQSSCLPLGPCWLSYHGTSVHVLLMFLYDTPHLHLFDERTSTANLLLPSSLLVT